MDIRHHLFRGSIRWRFLVVVIVVAQIRPMTADETPASNRDSIEVKTSEAKPNAKEIFPALTELEKQIITQVNEFRVREGRKEYSVSAKLCTACQVLMKDIIETSQFSHTAAGKTPAQRVDATGYQSRYLAENLFYQAGGLMIETKQQAAECLNGWKNSPGHRANLLSDQASECGIAYAIEEEKQILYVVMKYALPAEAE